MKTKRLKKLMMGLGLSRNQVNAIVAEQRAEGSKKVSNYLYWIIFRGRVRHIKPELFPYLSGFVLR